MRRFDPDTVPERPNLFFYKRGGIIIQLHLIEYK